MIKSTDDFVVFNTIWNYNVSVPLIVHSQLIDIIGKIALNFTTAKARIICRRTFGKLNSLCRCVYIGCLSDAHAVEYLSPADASSLIRGIKESYVEAVWSELCHFLNGA